MDFRCLETVLSVAKHKGFSSAEEATTYTQSAISKQVKSVEHEFQIKLFNREPKHFSITPEGEIFLKYAEEIVKSYSDLRRAVEMTKSGEIGKVNLAFTLRYAGSCSEKELTSGFLSQYPEADISIFNTGKEPVVPLLESGAANVGLIVMAGQVDTEFFYKKFHMVPVRKNRISLAVGKGHRLYDGPDEIDFSELDGEKVFLSAFAEDTFAQYGTCQKFEAACIDFGIKPHILKRSEYGGDRALYAIKGMIGPYFVDPPVDSYRNIRFLRLKEDPFPVNLWMVALKSDMTPILNNFFDYAHQQFARDTV